MKITGDYHTHTSYSDGKTSVANIVLAAKGKGLQEIAITDHSVGKLLKGLKRREFDKYVGEIESARSEMPVLIGVESNVVSVDGHIDIDDKMREKLDIVLFGVHAVVLYSFRGFLTFLLPNLFFLLIHYTPRFQIRRNTEIVKRVIENNNIDVWTHPNRYFKLDVLEVAKVCAQKNTLIELNSKRISFRQVDFQRMEQEGCKFIIGSDAHGPNRVGDTTHVEEFLKLCDYNPKNIININQTFTDYKNKRGQNDNTEQNKEPDTSKKPKRWRRWF